MEAKKASPAVDSHSISDFIVAPDPPTKQDADEEIKEPQRQARHRITGISRQASAAIEMASNLSLTSVLSPSVCLRQHLGGEQP